MAQEIINTGTGDNDGTGDSIRAGGVKINNNFTEVYGDITTLQTTTAGLVNANHISNVVDDTTPQLGGNLDTNGNNITGTGDINLADGNTGFVFDTSTGQVTFNSDGISALTFQNPAFPTGVGQQFSVGAFGSLILEAVDGGFIWLRPENGLKLDYSNWPTADGQNGQVLTTNGSGTLSWTDKTALVDLTGYATETYVDSAVSGLANTAYVDSSIPDLTGYATETYVDSAVSGLANTAYVDSSIANIVDSDAQTLTLTGTEITISNGNTIDLANTGFSQLSNIQDETYGVSVTGKIAVGTIDLGSGINASPGATFDLQGTTINFGSTTIMGGNAFNGTINNHLWSGSTAPANGYVLSWNTSALGGAGDYEWVSNVTNAGTALIDDTSPTLGADLNANTHSIDNVDTITGAPGAQFFVQAGAEGTWPASGENIYVIGYATNITGMFNLDLVVDDQAGLLGGIFIGDDNNKQKWPRSNNGQPGAGKVLRTADAAGNLEWADVASSPDANRIVYDLANPSTSEILVTDPNGVEDATYYGDVVDGAANNAVVLDISSRSFYGDTYGNHNGDVKTADGSQLILDVDQGDGTAILYGNVEGDLTGSVTHASGTSSFDKIEFKNVYSTLGDLPTASNVHGMFAHVHGTGKAYYAHAGNWVELANQSDITAGGASVTVSDSAPSTPTAGDLWWESDSGRLKVYYTDNDGSQWVDASPPLSGLSSIAQGNTSIDVTDTGINGHVDITTEGVARWEVTSAGHILPHTNATYDIGSAERKVRYLFLDSNTMFVGDTPFSEDNIDRSMEVYTDEPAPASATDTGKKGDVRIVDGYMYICTETDTWVRSPVETSW